MLRMMIRSMLLLRMSVRIMYVFHNRTNIK
jgi:hypothetical protein